MVDAMLARLRNDPELAERVRHHARTPGRAAQGATWPERAHPDLVAALGRRGIECPWSHQAEAADAALDGDPTLVVTPTASGKSLCYDLAVLSDMLNAPPQDRPSALYLFPTKALAQDQTTGINELLQSLARPGEAPPLGTWTYDGDTPAGLRRILRERGDLIVTNPAMLHVGILPHHLRWSHFFSRLRYVVVDELHTYTGIFGSSFANVWRRLIRICRHYGANPIPIACSATIDDPQAHFERIFERRPRVIARSGAPQAERHHIFWDPPIVNEPLGLKARAVDESRTVARHLLQLGVSSIVFARSRTAVEVLVKYLKDAARELGVGEERVVGYRGGYLPLLRRKIERGLRDGTIRLVVATNALELGVDIGSLDAVVMTGYPGTVASYHQQAGRAGRRSGKALAIMVASSQPLDQYVMDHPRHVLEGQGETAPADPNNLVIATNQIKCAAFELPFDAGEGFGAFEDAPELLSILASAEGPLLERAGRYHWMDRTFPAQEVPLDAVDMDTFIVLEETPTGAPDAQRGRANSLGHVDRLAALTTLHPEAIYQHQGVQYQIRALDWKGRRAYAKRVDVDWYTEAETDTDIQVLAQDGGAPAVADSLAGHGDVHVSILATLYKRIRFYTNENLETGPIDLPAEELDTTAFWLVIGEPLAAEARFAESTRSGALGALAHLFLGVAPLHVQLGRGALRGRGYGTHPHFDRPTVLLYEPVPGGVGLAERLFEARERIYASALDRLERCRCQSGCPGCVGLDGDRGAPAKRAAGTVLRRLLAGEEDGHLRPEGQPAGATPGAVAREAAR